MFAALWVRVLHRSGGPRASRCRRASPGRIFAVSAWRETSFFSPRERAALALAEEMTLLAGGVPDEVWNIAAVTFPATGVRGPRSGDRHHQCPQQDRRDHPDVPTPVGAARCVTHVVLPACQGIKPPVSRARGRHDWGSRQAASRGGLTGLLGCECGHVVPHAFVVRLREVLAAGRRVSSTPAGPTRCAHSAVLASGRPRRRVT